MLFRAVFTGVDHGELHMPPRHGDLFNPHRYPFLEGFVAGASPLDVPELQAQVVVPTIDDGTVYAVLERLVVFEGQRLSYKALDVEQIGSIYESLMGYHVERMEAPAVRMKSGQWLTVAEVLAVKPAQRAKWLKKEVGLSTAEGKKLAERFAEIAKGDLDDAEKTAAYQDALADYSAAGRKRDKSAVLARVGQLVLQPGAERRRTSSHYTPRSLSEPIVRRTLEPLLACMGDAPPSDRILELKVCDPAMGSGAFLVEACRFLADQLVAAWTREGKLEEVAKHAPGEDPVLHARRLVAQRCLYGVDKNEAAVELAKLSLWLVTLAKDLPFTFLDHALRHGDSLVGLSFDQIRSFHWKPGKQLELADRVLKEALDEAIAIRQQILDLAEDGSPEGQRLKEMLVRDAEDASARARLIGDVVVGAFFAESKDKAREKERARRLTLVERWLDGDEEAGEELRMLQAEIRARIPVFHWMLEFPEVFYAERPDPLEGGQVNRAAFMDAFVGNPPFLGGIAISGAFGPAYAQWLPATTPNASGRADLVAYFFRRADVLLGNHGTVAFIATNTIAQGDTREAGLRELIRTGALIYDATTSRPWPGQAAVSISVVHFARGRTAQYAGSTFLDGAIAETINSRLRAGPERSDPVRLPENQGRCYFGVTPHGSGFFLSAAERDRLLEHDPKSAPVVRPYIGGERISQAPDLSFDRYIIYFGQAGEAEAQAYPGAYSLVEERVKPERARLRDDNAAARQRKRYWWRYAGTASDLNAALQSLARCLVVSQVTKHLAFAFQPTDRVFSKELAVFVLESSSAFAVLQSRTHEPWARLLSSSMKTDLRYAASDCFETFPFPSPNRAPSSLPSKTWASACTTPAPRTWSRPSRASRRPTTCSRTPTATTPPSRNCAACTRRWTAPCSTPTAGATSRCPPTARPPPAEQKALEAFSDEVIDRLFVLNAERAADEARRGIGTKARKREARMKPRAREKEPSVQQRALDLGDDG
ncbi:MAG: N-6 DNA methylase [Sandaracinaceae bacterium]|nr:N-6 DNA methylase [Sandaracinaceae bacterium]